MVLHDIEWAALLVEATRFEQAFSLSYGLDLRYLFFNNWIASLEQHGLPVMRRQLPKYLLKDAVFLYEDKTPIPKNRHTREFDAAICLRYGFSDYSYLALNYRNQEDVLPKDFVNEDFALSLGNIGICVNAKAPGITLMPPPEISVRAVVEIPIGKTRALLGWLGIRYVRRSIDKGLLDTLEAIESVFVQAVPLTLKFSTEPTCKHRYLQFHFKSRFFKVTDGQEHEIRLAWGYPEKGKTGFREKMLYDSACLIFGEKNVIRRYRGKELGGLEIDVWVPSYKIALEYQGEQHFKNINHWHGENGLTDQKSRDKYKQDLCKSLNYRLLLFFPNDQLDFISVLAALRKQWWI
jgi:hypothetical protein